MARVDAGEAMRIGLISDTHGLLRPEAIAILRGCDRIIHGGDIGDATILERLEAIAPVDAVRGNNDVGAWADPIPETRVVRIGTVGVYVIHDLAQLEFDPHAADLRAVVSGHSHRPRVFEREGVLFVNPGSAGRRRFRLPISIGELRIDGDRVAAQLHELPG